jgi:hypothetical protein
MGLDENVKKGRQSAEGTLAGGEEEWRTKLVGDGGIGGLEWDRD